MTVVHRAILSTVWIATVPLLGLVGARLLLPVEMPALTRDVAAIAGIHPLSGILSSLGILLWWTSSTIWFFSAFLRRAHGDATVFGFMISSGLLSTYLTFDDLFQFHEHLAPTYLNVSERTVYGFLGFGIAMYLWRYRRFVTEPDGLLLLLALGFLAASVVIDAVLGKWLWRLKDWSYFVEDGLKWLGICYWTAFSIVACSKHIESASASGQA